MSSHDAAEIIKQVTKCPVACRVFSGDSVVLLILTLCFIHTQSDIESSAPFNHAHLVSVVVQRLWFVYQRMFVRPHAVSLCPDPEPDCRASFQSRKPLRSYFDLLHTERERNTAIKAEAFVTHSLLQFLKSIVNQLWLLVLSCYYETVVISWLRFSKVKSLLFILCQSSLNSESFSSGPVN